MEHVGKLMVLQDEAQVVRSAAAGNTAAFDLLMERYSTCVYRLALRMLGHREEAEDVLQEAFLQAYRKLHTYRGEAAFSTWLYSITARLCLSRRRRTARQPVVIHEPVEVHAYDAPDPQTQLDATAAAAQVQQALTKLSPPDRLLIVLKYIENLDHEEIARIMKCSPESSRSRLSRAKRLFREQFGEVE